MKEDDEINPSYYIPISRYYIPNFNNKLYIWTSPEYKASQDAKRRVINLLVTQLQEMHYGYVEEALEKSDMKQAKEVIAYIRSLPQKR